MGIINQAETIRSQIYSLQDENLYEMYSTGRGQDYTFREPSRLLIRLLGLVGHIANADFPPTVQLTEMAAEFADLQDGYLNQFNAVLAEDLPAFNSLLEENDLPPIAL